MATTKSAAQRSISSLGSSAPLAIFLLGLSNGSLHPTARQLSWYAPYVEGKIGNDGWVTQANLTKLGERKLAYFKTKLTQAKLSARKQ